MAGEKKRIAKVACKCFDTFERDLLKTDMADRIEFEALDVAINLKTGAPARRVFVIKYAIESAGPRPTSKPKRRQGYALANFCPMCGVEIGGRAV